MNAERKRLAHAAMGGVVVWLAHTLLSVLPKTPGPGDAATARALQAVERLAAEPHPAGSAAHAAARAWLEGELRALGLEPELQAGLVEAPPWLPALPWLEPAEGTAADAVPRGSDGRPLIPLTNVLVRVKGRSRNGAVLLQAHYDSASRAPGAGDDAVGVVALLETLRALLPGAPYENDLIFHFDDGEELGLLGAQLFADRHPWMEDVRCVLNFDARGNAGPSICFEVGAGSAPLVRLFAESAAHPVGASLAAAVYERLPNDTSFTPFRARGLPGLNFAFVGGVSAYHRPWDTPENLSKGTLMHQTGCAVAITRAAADADLDELAGDAVFFNVLPRKLVVYPLAWALPLGLLQAGLAALVLALAARARVRVGTGLLRAVVFGAIVFAAVRVAWTIVDFVVRGGASLVLDADPHGNLPSTTLTALGAAIAGLAASLVLLERSSAPARAEIAAGGALIWSVLLLLCTFLLPAASYIFGWPLMLALPVLWSVTRHPRATESAPGYLAFAVAMVSLAAIALLLVPTYHLLVQVGATNPSRMANFASALSALGLVLVQPHLAFLLGGRRCANAAFAGVLGLLCLVASALAAAMGR